MAIGHFNGNGIYFCKQEIINVVLASLFDEQLVCVRTAHTQQAATALAESSGTTCHQRVDTCEQLEGRSPALPCERRTGHNLVPSELH